MKSTGVASAFICALLVTTFGLSPTAPRAEELQRIPVRALAEAPRIDGTLTDWGPDDWQNVTTKPALDQSERARFGMTPDDQNRTGTLTVRLKAGVHRGRFYLALRYPDASPDTFYRMWEWRGERYGEGRQREDMLALRFHLDGDFDRSMLSARDYRTDVWLWSAARTNPAGIAEDMSHHMTTALLENAAEYTSPDGRTIYIRKRRDAGDAPYRMLPRPKEHRGDKLPSFELAPPSGSAADVAARGEWQSGHWQLEFGRALDTGHPDDAAFRPGRNILGQIAVFNKGFAEHKSISEPLNFDFSAIR